MPARAAEASWCVALSPGPPFRTAIRKAHPSSVQDPEGNGWARVDHEKEPEKQAKEKSTLTTHSALSYKVCVACHRVKLLLTFEHLAECGCC